MYTHFTYCASILIFCFSLFSSPSFFQVHHLCWGLQAGRAAFFHSVSRYGLQRHATVEQNAGIRLKAHMEQNLKVCLGRSFHWKPIATQTLFEILKMLGI